MKSDKRTLYLVRHAKAAKFSNDLHDIDRPLTETGVEESYLVARQLFLSGEIPEILISSSGTRAISTAMIFQRELNLTTDKIRIVNKLYETDLNGLFEFVAHLDDRYHSVMLFGHNPVFTQFAAKMEPSIIHMSTASVIKFEFEVEKWRHSSYINAEQRLFISP